MKILIIAPSRKLGGIERALSVIANEWSKKSLDITYVSCLKSDPFYKLNSNIKIVEPSFKRSIGLLNKIFFYPKLIMYLRRQIKIEKPDRILSFGDVFNSLVLLASNGIKTPVYISDRTSPDFKFPLHITILKKWMYPKSSGFIAQTSRSFDAKEKLFGKSFRQIIIPNAIREIKKYNVTRESIILYVGRFSWEKNPKVLIEAFSKIENKKNWKLVMAGTGPQLEEMKIKAINLGLKDKIDFPGKVSDIDFWYNKSSIFVLPSILEGFPNALCEAMAASLPVICFDSIPYESIITPNIDGVVIPITEKNSLEKALSELMTDKNKRTKIGNRAHQKSQDWKVEIIINKFNEFLKINE